MDEKKEESQLKYFSCFARGGIIVFYLTVVRLQATLPWNITMACLAKPSALGNQVLHIVLRPRSSIPFIFPTPTLYFAKPAECTQRHVLIWHE